MGASHLLLFTMRKNFLFSLLFLLLSSLPLWATSLPMSYVAYEVNSGRVMYSYNAEKTRPIAGLSQVATALVVLDWVSRYNIPLNRVITVPLAAGQVRGANPMNLRPGCRITLRDALYSTLLGSDNVAAWTLAHYVGSDISLRHQGKDPIPEFVIEMNLLAKALGMTNTEFTSPHGLDYGKTSLSTAADLALLGLYAMRNDAFAFIVAQPSRRIGVELEGQTQFYDVKNTNILLKDKGIDGIKTGKSQAAGACALISAKRDSVRRFDARLGREAVYPQRMIVVVLDCEDRFNLSRELIREGWKEFDRWLNQNQPRNENEKRFMQFKGDARS